MARSTSTISDSNFYELEAQLAGTLRPVIRPDRSVEAATMMSLTLSVDHRVIDGALGAALLQSITSHLESPIALLA